MALAIRCYARFTSFGLGFIHVRRAGEFATASGSCVVVNVASNEYSAVLPRSEIPEGFTWVDCVFKDSGRILSVYGNFDIIQLRHYSDPSWDSIGRWWRGVAWRGVVRCGAVRWWEVGGEGGGGACSVVCGNFDIILDPFPHAVRSSTPPQPRRELHSILVIFLFSKGTARRL